MFDPDLIDSYPPETRGMIRQSLALLASTGVLLAQKQRLFARIAEGADNEDEVTLSGRIIVYRREAHALQYLHDQGLEYLEQTGEN
jgi:hypothetical protein